MWLMILLIVDGFSFMSNQPQPKGSIIQSDTFGRPSGKSAVCLIVKYMFVLSFVLLSHHFSHFLCKW